MSIYLDCEVYATSLHHPQHTLCSLPRMLFDHATATVELDDAQSEVSLPFQITLLHGDNLVCPSQMLRKSVETRDWLNTIEPRNVRAVMKRVVEDVTFIDSQVGMLYEEGVRKAHSSDSSKRTFQSYSGPRKHQSTARSFTPR